MGLFGMDGDQAVAARRGMDEGRAETGLELVESAPQGQQGRVNGRVGGVVAKQTCLDQVSRRRRLGTLGQEQHERGLLLREASVPLAQPYGAPGRVELQPAKAVAPGPARS